MEDGVTEITDRFFSDKDISSKVEEKERVDVGEENEKEKNSGGGVISNLISALVSKDSDEKSNGGEVMEQRKDDKEEKEGGVLNHLISNLVSPSSARVRDHDGSSTNLEEEKSGGIFNNLISGILHHGGGGGEDEKHEGNDHAEGGGGGGGLIDNIVSHLPTPLADDAAPASEEASMLIHSIVHD